MESFIAAVDAYVLEEVDLDLASVPDVPLLVLGEPHGAEQTARVVWTVVRRLHFDRVALEWPEDELAQLVGNPGAVGALPAEAEARSGEGRFSAGLFALARSLPRPPLLLDLTGEHGDDRSAWLCRRLLALRNEDERTLALVGASHAVHMQQQGIPVVLLDYDGGHVTHRGVHALGDSTLPPGPPRLSLEAARPAVVPS